MTNLFFKRDLAECCVTSYVRHKNYRVSDLLHISRVDSESVWRVYYFGDPVCYRKMWKFWSYDPIVALCYAKLGGHAWIIEERADRIRIDWTDLMCEAVCRGQLSIVKLAVQHSADTRAGLRQACIYRQKEIVSYFKDIIPDFNNVVRESQLCALVEQLLGFKID